MTEAPERIWAWYFIEGKQEDVMKGGWNDQPDRREVEYIRADVSCDLHKAEIAAAYEAAAKTLEERGSDGWAEHVMAEYASVMGESIRTLTPSDAKAALEAYVSRAVDAERKRCARIAESHPMRFAGQTETTIRSAIAAAIAEGGE